MPVANYASEMLELWKIGCEENVPIEFENEKRAIRFRFRMYCLRKDMREESHLLLPFAEKCMIRLQGKTAIICPVDDDFAVILRKQGIIVDETITGQSISSAIPEESGDEIKKAVDDWKVKHD